VPPDVLDSHYLVQVALLDPAACGEVERQFILPQFDVALSAAVATVDDWHDVPGLAVRPPDVRRYLVRAKPDALRAFAEANGLADLPARDLRPGVLAPPPWFWPRVHATPRLACAKRKGEIRIVSLCF